MRNVFVVPILLGFACAAQATQNPPVVPSIRDVLPTLPTVTVNPAPPISLAAPAPLAKDAPPPWSGAEAPSTARGITHHLCAG